MSNLVEVFQKVRRVLHPSGTLILNLGDSYASSGKSGKTSNKTGLEYGGRTSPKLLSHTLGRAPTPPGLKPKDLCGIPFRVVMALQADGWWWRQTMVWLKVNAMPECLDPNTRIFVRENDRISQVNIDYAIGKDNLEILTPAGWRKILNAWETYKSERVTFDAAKVSTITCSQEHLWPVSHDRRRNVVHEMPTSKLRDDGYNDYLLHYSIDQFLEPSIHSLWTQPLDYDLGWLLGIYAAEGGFDGKRGHRCKFTLHKDEKDFADRIDKIAAYKFSAVSSHREIKNYRQVRFSNFEFHALVNMVLPGKCKTKELNLDIILNAPKEFRQGIWDGYIDGDGSKRQSGVTATSASVYLRDTMTVLASSLGVITSKKTNQQYDRRTRKTYISYQLWTPYIKHRKQKKNHNARQITIRNKQVEKGHFRMIDLEVEGGLFLIEDGIATHNSVRDRPTTAHEYVFLLAKSKQYFWDAEAVRTSLLPDSYRLSKRIRKPHKMTGQFGAETKMGLHKYQPSTAGRNYRTTDLWFASLDEAIEQQRAYLAHLEHVKAEGGLLLDEDGEPLALNVTTAGSGLAHFAIFPTKLVLPFVRAGSSQKGVCPECGGPWERVVERQRRTKTDIFCPKHLQGNTSGLANPGWRKSKVPNAYSTTLGWRPTCSCNAGDPIPATILDPFSGAGTTLLVADREQRDAIGLELSPEYAQMSHDRIKADGGMFVDVRLE